MSSSDSQATLSVDRVSLGWYKRVWTPGAPLVGPTRVSIDEICPGSGREHRLMQGDALRVCGRLHDEGMAGKVKLVYVDPPYFSQSDYVHEARLDGKKDGRVRRTLAYEDNWTHAIGNIAGYLEMLAPRLEAAARLLSPDGTIWVHLDWRASYLARCILDEVMGRDAFLNEVVWKRAPNLGRQAQSFQFG
ncbi:MAG: hypothetical protein KBF88_17825, partial [Polyangiaceae bacterium]|nr:hypothetical protein [Polyangiaceae bacterium]